MERSELEAINNCQQGKLREFSVLYDKYVNKIYNYLYYRTHHKETAEDLTSQSFLKALDNINKFKPSKGVFSAWLYRIARNTLYDHYRTNKINIDIDNVWGLSSQGEDIERDIDSQRTLSQVAEYLKHLTKDQRDIIIMRVWDELSYKEIATILNKSEASCKMAFSRAIAKLRQDMPLTLFIFFLLSNLKKQIIN